MEHRLLDQGYTKTLFMNRLDRYLMLKIRACISQQYAYIPQNGYLMMRKEAKNIVSCKEVREFCRRYPSNQLKMKHRAFFNLVRYELVDLIFLLFKIARQ